MSSNVTKYGNWRIEYNPPPIPVRSFDWQFWHDDYDGAEDADDMRAGAAGSKIGAMLEIDELCEDYDLKDDASDRAWILAANQARARSAA